MDCEFCFLEILSLLSPSPSCETGNCIICESHICLHLHRMRLIIPHSRSTLLVNMLVIIVYHLNIPSLTPCTFGVPLFVLMNTLAAHIYRNIRFKVYTDQTITSSALNRNLIGMGAGTTDTGIRPSSSLNPKSNNRDPLVMNITFQRTVTTTSTTGTGTRRHSMGEISSIRGDVGPLDLEKQDGMDSQY